MLLVVCGEVKLGEYWLGWVVVFDGVFGDFDYFRWIVIKLFRWDGVFIVGEVNYLVGGIKVVVGMWGYIVCFDLLLLFVLQGWGNKGVYVFVEYCMIGICVDDVNGFVGWLWFGVVDMWFNVIVSYLGGGLVYIGIVFGWVDDQVGFLFVLVNFGDCYCQSQVFVGNLIDFCEVVVEVVYNVVIVLWLSVQFDV